MSKGIISKNQRMCATCEHWRGFRDISKNNVVFESQGECMSARSPKKGKKVIGTLSCAFWNKWSSL